MSNDVIYPMKEIRNIISTLSISLCIAALGLSGCAMGNTSIAQEDAATITLKIIPGKTTQEEVRQMYGTPMGVEMNGDGTETWIYSMMDTKFRTYVPFAGMVVGNDGTQSKYLTVKFNRNKVAISRDLSFLHDDSAETNPANSQKVGTTAAEIRQSEPKKSETLSDKPIATKDVIGTYENRSESSFIFSLQINKDGSALYQEPDPEGKKTIKLRGKWRATGNNLEINFGKAGRYSYSIQPSLSWADFGCRGSSFGLKNLSTPQDQKGSINHNVWRKSDMKKADACRPL